MKTARQSKIALRMVHSGRLQFTRTMIIPFVCVYCKDVLGRAFSCPRGCTFPLCKMFANQIQALTTTVNLVRGAICCAWPPQGYLKH